MAIGTGNLADSDYPEANAFMDDCARQHNALVDQAVALLDAQRRITND